MATLNLYQQESALLQTAQVGVETADSRKLKYLVILFDTDSI